MSAEGNEKPRFLTALISTMTAQVRHRSFPPGSAMSWGKRSASGAAGPNRGSFQTAHAAAAARRTQTAIAPFPRTSAPRPTRASSPTATVAAA